MLNVYGRVDSDVSLNQILVKLGDISGVKRVVDETEIREPIAVPAAADTLGEETEEISEEPDESAVD